MAGSCRKFSILFPLEAQVSPCTCGRMTRTQPGLCLSSHQSLLNVHISTVMWGKGPRGPSRQQLLSGLWGGNLLPDRHRPSTTAGA